MSSQPLATWLAYRLFIILELSTTAIPLNSLSITYHARNKFRYHKENVPLIGSYPLGARMSLASRHLSPRMHFSPAMHARSEKKEKKKSLKCSVFCQAIMLQSECGLFKRCFCLLFPLTKTRMRDSHFMKVSILSYRIDEHDFSSLGIDFLHLFREVRDALCSSDWSRHALACPRR